MLKQDLSQPNARAQSGITEVVLPDAGQLHLVLPTLAHLSQQTQNRWLTWFPPKGVTKQTLQAFHFHLPNVRLIHTRDHEQQLWYFWEALAEGNSHTVVGHLGKLADNRVVQLEHAASVGSCTGLLIRYR